LFFLFLVNLFGIIRVVKAFLPILKQQAIERTLGTEGRGGGRGGMRIINMISAAGYASSMLGISSYTTTKHAAQAFTDTLREELVPFNIAVTTVNPSYHSTAIVTSIEERVEKLYREEIPKEMQQQYGECKSSCHSTF
jgi:NAD(P)-dependent dehydrogenase (short-subunit alcohol dehydrogenase family)